jgi:tetratricopeptide (TPR) repeat protein
MSNRKEVIIESDKEAYSDHNLSEESTLGDNESLTSSNIIRVSQDLSKLFNANEYYEILTLIPSLNKYPNLPASARIIISLTLFKLGRVGPALRELSITIEISTNQAEKEKLIKYLIQIFKTLGLLECAVYSFEELINMARLDLLISSENEAKVPRIQERVDRYESELNKYLNCYEKGGMEM